MVGYIDDVLSFSFGGCYIFYMFDVYVYDVVVVGFKDYEMEVVVY